MNFKKITDLNLFGKRVLIRSDLNVPIKNGRMISDMRIRESLRTINFALNQGAKVIVMSHLGNPIEGSFNKKYSLYPISKILSQYIDFPIRFIKNYLNGIQIIDNSKLILLENVRFNIGEFKNDIFLSKKYANLCDIYVMDAFATAHRIHASTYGVVNFVKKTCIGKLFLYEIKNLKNIFSGLIRPITVILGGKKISTKLNILDNLIKKVDYVILCGEISNVFISVKTCNFKLSSFYNKKMILKIKKILSFKKVIIPVDVYVQKKNSQSYTLNNIFKKPINQIGSKDQIVDLGPETIKKIIRIIKITRTILWNGPIGAYENPCFRKGTKMIAESILNNKNICSIVGGGGTISSIELLNLKQKFSYISTGGNACLEFFINENFPVIKLLK
ncbi:MAG: phosphoglycerate kinase [Arsenophonus sp.]|nr:MAG: phosphoglycerate kinase [Arsenophonus sp.]